MDSITQRFWIRAALAVAVIATITTTGLPLAQSQDDTEPAPATNESPSDHQSEAPQSDPLGGESISTNGSEVALADISASLTGNTEGEDDAETSQEPVVELVISPIAPAEKGTSVDYVPPCAVDRSGVTSTALGYEAEELSDEERRERYGASDEELLTHINSLGDPMAHTSEKPVKSPVSQARLLFQDNDVQPVNIDGVFQIFEDIAAAEQAARDAITNALGLPTTGCDIYYRCGAERVDDIISGQIDSEPAGAYADYVTAVASNLAILTANIRNAESTPPLSAGETAPNIPSPTSPESVLTLTNYLADQGLGEPPADLHLPVFHYCRIDDGGPIEIDPAADPAVQPSFTWTPIDEEFDIDRTSQQLADQITRTLYGQLPQTRTIPPLETGYAIVQFPAWLWLNEPFVTTDLEALSNLQAIRIQARATLDHVTWKLGDTTLECTLDDMTTYTPNTGMNPAIDTPHCHHIFTQLGNTTLNATATYQLEQNIATRSLGYPWPADNWQPHPTTPTVNVTSTTTTLTVAPITAVNVPINDYTDE